MAPGGKRGGKARPRRRVGQKTARKSAAALLRRFPVTDLAEAMAETGEARRECLTRFVNGTPMGGGFGPVRSLFRRIYGAHGGNAGAAEPLVETLPPDEWEHIEAAIRGRATKAEMERNVAVGRLLFDHARGSPGYEVANIEPRAFAVSRANVRVGLDFALSDRGRIVLQFPHLRQRELLPEQRRILASIIREAYAPYDYLEGASIEIVSFCPPKRNKPREPLLMEIPTALLWDRKRLAAEAEDVVRVLLEVVEAWP